MSQIVLKMGTRGSKLALAQADLVRRGLEKARPDVLLEQVVIRTKGDRVQDRPFHLFGGLSGVFVKEIEQALLDGEIDFAVHSGKDLPSSLADGLCLAAIPEREEPGDAWISARASHPGKLPRGATVGTSSLRRQALLYQANPGIEVTPIRGNVDSRLAKLDGGKVDGLVLAVAGLKRVGLEHRITSRLDPEVFLPSPAQGALALECRADDRKTRSILEKLHHEESGWAVKAERAFLAGLGAGCQIPLAAYAVCSNGNLTLRGWLASPDGRYHVQGMRLGDVADAGQLGRDLADGLYRGGGEEILTGWREYFQKEPEERGD